MSRVTSRGQVTLPKRIRDELGLIPGSEVEFEIRDGQVFLLKKTSEPKLARWQGYLCGKLPQGSVDTFLDDLRGEPGFEPSGPRAVTEEPPLREPP